MASSSGRIFVSEIEKDAIRSAATEHNREISLIIHQLIHGENVHHTIRDLYSKLDNQRARKRVYDFLQREVKKATNAKLIQHTRHVDPELYMASNQVTFRSSQRRGSGRGRRASARRACSRQDSIIGPILHRNNNISIINDHEYEEQNEQYLEQSGYNDDQQWEDEASDEEEHHEAGELTFDHHISQSEGEDMAVDQPDNHLKQPTSVTTTNLGFDSQIVADQTIATVVENSQSRRIQSTSNTSGLISPSIASPRLNQTDILNSRLRQSVEYSTPVILNRTLISPHSNHHSINSQSSVTPRNLNTRGRSSRRYSQSNTQRRDSTMLTTDNVIDHITNENDDDDQTSEQEPRRSLTRVLIETADSLKEAARMATRACGLAMQKINEL